jgi:hypothetical protein
VRWMVIGMVGLIVAGAAGRASGTVYAWRESDGVHHFTNFLEDVPEEHRSTVQSFVRRTAPPAEAETTAGTEPGAPPEVEGDGGESYGRAVERGATIALEQTRAVGELARSLVEALRRDAPAPHPVEWAEPPRRSPEFRVSIIPAGRRWPARVFYGAIAPDVGCSGCCCGTSFGYGFAGGRLIPHSHFFPSLAGARHAPLFFPNGHMLDADLFLVGDGYWID